MLIGHFGPAFLVRALRGSPSLAACFAAVTLVDLGYMNFVFAGLAPADKDGMMVGALVLSHWFLDLPFHRADLPLVLDWGTKYGWALWDRPMLSLAVELAVTFGTFYVYLSRTRPTKLGNGWVWALGIVMVAECYAVYFNASPPDPAARSGAVDMSLYSIPLYVLPTILAHMVDRSRVVV
ncbi:hypothetical protein DFJ74DRAFT_711389 [Hyaloraphidium curvatum]|nr:hypothetical protein DFJ74DRAFT_711389 [Hyaloraphidium curvatum]